MLSWTSRLPPVRPRPRIFTSFKLTTGCSKPALPSVEHAALTTIAAEAATKAIFPIASSPSCLPSLRLFVRRRALPKFLPPRQSFRDFLLEAEWSWLVEARAAQSVRQVLLRDICLRSAMRVLIPLTIAQFLHQTGRCIPDMHRYGFRGVPLRRLERRAEGHC